MFQYITILFAAAFVLLLYTFMMERRQNDILQQQSNDKLNQLQQQSVSAVQSLDNLYQENRMVIYWNTDFCRCLWECSGFFSGSGCWAGGSVSGG